MPMKMGMSVNVMDSWVQETVRAAANIEHEWDQKAVEWPDLTADSVVIECGSFKGRWALQMAQRYAPNLFCFEPQDWACEVTRRVLAGAATVLNYGLGDWNRVVVPMSGYGTDGCTFTESGNASGDIREIAGAFQELGITAVDLMLINIEGYEYTLIPHMFKQRIFPRRLMVQMHDGAEWGLRALLDQHYVVLWDYGRTLSAWEKRE